MYKSINEQKVNEQKVNDFKTENIPEEYFQYFDTAFGSYDICIVVDNSSSTLNKLNPEELSKYTIYDEIKSIADFMFKYGNILDDNGIDIIFLNGDKKIHNVNTQDKFDNLFSSFEPNGTTPLADTLKIVTDKFDKEERGKYVIVLTDGVDNSGIDNYKNQSSMR